MNLDEEAERLLRLHPAVRAGVQPEYHDTHWLPQHAVPRRPAPYRPTDAQIEARVAADLAAIDRELDPQAPPPVFGELLLRSQASTVYPRTYVDFGFRYDVAAFSTIAWRMAGRMAASQNMVGSPSFQGQSIHDLLRFGFGYDVAAPAAPKKPKPKTYVAPGRKAGRTWITRLEQSKQARAKR